MSATEAPAVAGNGHVGRSLRRKEDPRLIRGQASYVDDINLTGQLWAAWVRSPEAHAKIVSIDTSAAKARDGVVAVYTNEDLDMEAGLPMAWVPPGVDVNTPDHWVLAKGEVKHVGDPVALVIGNDRYTVVDAAEDVFVEYDPLPVVTDPEAALEDGSALVHPQFGTNKVCEWSLGGGDLEAGFAEADHIIERRIVNHRTAGAAIEPRAVLADFRADRLTVYSSTQVPHFLRLFLGIILGISEDRVRAVAPEVGGAFGSKLQIYAEEIGCAWASRKLGRPVKWVETRSEGMMVTHHGRDQIDKVKVGFKNDGTMTAFHVTIIADLGAYQMLLTPMIPPLSAFVMCGVYKTPAVHTDVIDVMTNKFPTDAIRGAGRPEATHLIEVTIDQIAAELGMDPLEVRRRNFIPPFSEAHETPIGVAYDSGDYAKALDKLLEHIDPAEVHREAEALREKGIYRGIGFCTYTEICGNAPSRIVGPGGFGLQGGGWESAQVRVHASGSATVYTGSSPHGQGHETGFAQIVADRLGIDPQQVDVIHGDTAHGPVRPGHLRLAHAGRGRRGDGQGGREGGRQGQGDRRPPARGRPGRHRAARRQVDRPRLAREGHGAGRRGRRGLRPREPARRHGARARRDGVLRPGELRLPVRGARLRRRRRRRDRQGRDRPLRRGRRLRAGDQPDAHRRPGPRRHHARGRTGPLRAGPLRRGRPAGDRLVRRLRAGHRGGAAELRDGPHGDALTGQLARRQGRRRGGHDRRVGDGDQCRDRRAAPARSHLHGHAAHAHEGLDGHQRGEGRIPVIPPEFDYVAPETLADALSALTGGGEDAKVLAGGHSLLPLMKLRLAAPTLLVDLRKVPGLRGVQRENGQWRIGAMTRHADLQGNADLGVVGLATALIADQQVRNRGTIGGSLAHGDPASDLPTVFLACEGSLTVVGAGGTREVAAADMFQDYLTTAVGEDEIVTEVRVPSFDGWGSSYQKFTRRAEDWAMVAVCAMVKKAGDGSVEDVRIALTNMGSTPLRATAAEAALRGKGLDAIAGAAELAAEGTDPPGDLNATPDYKRHLARVLTRRALEEAAA